MSDHHPIPRFMLMSSNILGHMEEADTQLTPLEVQVAAKPGDYALLGFGGNVMEADLTIAQILDPREYASTFPDWEVREMKSRVLCRWVSLKDRAGDIGWFARVKLILLTEEQYNQVIEWMDTPGAKEKVPDWMEELYESYTIQIHEQAPDKVPSVVICEECGGHSTQLHVRQLVQHRGRAGLLEKDGKKEYHIISEPEHKEETGLYVRCEDCNHRQHLDPDQLG